MERREIAIGGIVQGVGFRPFVYGLASRLSLNGFVRNTPRGVLIEVEGDPGALAAFERELRTNPPPLASIDQLVAASLPVRGDAGFSIDPSEVPHLPADLAIRIAPDVATCAGCVAEMHDPANRRHRYPFITCATCGPRLTIVTGAPYDRERTTMASFRMCNTCRREYEDPLDRRFHAETIACAVCGPSVRLSQSPGVVAAGDAFYKLAVGLRAGLIAAIKGIGGYHLACDAGNDAVVAELRRRKHRDEKPFAVMFGTIEEIEQVCHVSREECTLLTSPARPIVLLERRDAAEGCGRPASAVAPGMRTLGAMLPATPLHHLLMETTGRPLVMTSGNRSQEPIVTRDDEVFERLAGIADLFLTHDRPIHVRCDDGVGRVVDGEELPIRRSRGDAPRPLRLTYPCPESILAAGGHLKNTFALGRGSDAYISHHIGDLDDYAAREAFGRDVRLYEELLSIAPKAIAHDLHPDYASTRYAMERAAADGLRTISVQHHHAHVASCMAEHGRTAPVIGVAFDGSGFGEDGTIWGGEFLVGDACQVERAAHLRVVPLPGGEQAVREPWRMALAHLADAGCDAAPITARHGSAAGLVIRMMERCINSPRTSSAGRLFDAVAAIAGLGDRVSFEGQAAMRLEAEATRGASQAGYPMELRESGPSIEVDTRPLICAAANDAASGSPASIIARRFHVGLADAIVAVCTRIRESSGHDTVALTGGVFLNALLTHECSVRLSSVGFQVLRHRLVPPNDGGLSLGQLAVAAAREMRGAGCGVRDAN
ncbi:MAG: carbamoyltransferase HypF [Acidobacteria bacterium]|nr:carbamoyltransferase HypF [Acidobacteriota bacterium]